MTKVKHTSGGRSIDVHPALVGEYESQGWVQQPATPATKARAARKRASSKPDSTDASTGTTP